MCRGPVSANMVVYSDFETYTGGVYSPTRRGVKIGLHTIRIIGWGTSERGTDYWTCVNSWGSDWGESGGLFRLKMGTCDIESTVLALIPEVHHRSDRVCLLPASKPTA